MANAVGREIIAAGLHDPEFVAHATSGFEDYRAHVESYTLDYAELVTGVPGEAIREMAHAYATADKAQILWTLGITEHHNGVDNVKSLCNLALLTGHVGRWGSGLVPLRGQNNVQGGGDMGALPNKFPGFQDIVDPVARAKFESVYGMELNPEPGLHLTLMFEAMDEGVITGAYIIGENPADSEADVDHARRLLAGLESLGRARHLHDSNSRTWPTSCCRRRLLGRSAKALLRPRSDVCSVYVPPWILLGSAATTTR